MITPRSSHCCKDCVDILPLIEKIDCKLYELSLGAYNNIIFSMNNYVNQEAVYDLLNYRRILTYKLVNPNYAFHFSENQIASKIKKYIVGCRPNCDCNKTPSIGFMPSTTTTTSSSSSSTTTTTTTLGPINFSFDSASWGVNSITDSTSFINFLEGRGLSSVVVSNFSIVNNGTLQCNLSFSGSSLDLSSCFITKINNTNALVLLDFLILSNNSITTIENLDSLSNLSALSIDNNNLSTISGLDNLINLDSLMLFNNQISIIENLNNLSILTSLDLSDNLIDTISDLSALTQLDRLNLNNNHITDMLPLGFVSNTLTSLDLSNNSISEIHGLEGLTNLGFLFLSNNALTFVDNIGTLVNLTSLDLDGNSITAILIGNLDNLPLLSTLFLQNNLLTTVVYNFINSWAIITVPNGFLVTTGNTNTLQTTDSLYITLHNKGWTINT